MPDNQRRLYLRVTLKLLTLTALLVIAYALLNSGNEEEESAPATTTKLELNGLQPVQPQRITWEGGPLQLLRMEVQGPIYLFYDRGGNLGCPLAWQAPGKHDAPSQPWPGGFRDQCSGTWYRYDGQALPGQSDSQRLQSPPYRLLHDDLLEIGVNGDNAPPAS